MTTENAHVTQEKQRLAAEIERGLQEGYDSAIKPLPSWWHTEPLIRLTAYQRGYFVGVQLYLSEIEAE